MRCLWLTLADPDPQHNGQLIYSGGLIDGLASAGVAVEVIGLARPENPRRFGEKEGNATWWLAPGRMRSRARSMFSTLPHMASRASTAPLRKLLSDRLEQNWDAIVIDGLSAGWAAAGVAEYRRKHGARTKIAYISHNHEPSLRSAVARSHPPGPMRAALAYDALKVGRLERRIISLADLVTAITPEDRQLYAAQWPDTATGVLMPGYRSSAPGGGRAIASDRPRRAVIVGSFDWVAKRLNLQEFLAVADPLFAASGVELQVVGSADPLFLERMRRHAMATEFTGKVDDVDRYMDQARMALVPELHGGGFKLKVLDYVFRRLPILAIHGSVAGMPLTQGESILYFRDHLSLAKGVVRVMDDFDRLNGLQESAIGRCHDQFDWRDRGAELRDMLAAA